jgi:hypothetical protein
MKIIHNKGFSQQEIDGIQNSIHNCCLDAMKDLLKFMNSKGIEGLNDKYEVRYLTFGISKHHFDDEFSLFIQ